MSGEIFTAEAFPFGLTCTGCGYHFEEGDLVCEKPADHPNLRVVGEMVTGGPVMVVELVCRECR